MEIYQKFINRSVNKCLESVLSLYSNLKLGTRKKCLVYGNCQSPIISRILSANPEFSRNYEMVNFKPVFKIGKSDLENLKSIIQEIDLFIYQPVRSGYRGLEELGTDYLKNLLKPHSLPISFH
ncbi:MAG: WcbI family polysaccharide biosynthesis putative acetyltransferase [Dolichospermum sp.]